MFREDPTLFVDEAGELLYVEEASEPRESIESEMDLVMSAAPPTTDAVFSLASRPGADHTIYLDFDGHVTEGTSWNNADRPSIVSPPYDLDGDPETWTSTELANIRAAYEGVAEDFAPFDVNVTTIEPALDDLRNSGNGDQRWGTRVLTTVDTAGFCGCGGIAYIGSFDDRTDEPVYVFNSSRTGVLEAISHEVGHAMLLAHDGQSTTGYYRGHGSGDSSWGPIMGASYNRTVTQWSRGEYFDANNLGSDANFGNGEDDLEVLSSLTNGNGFGYVDDDHGDTTGDATSAQSGTYTGVISKTSDVDAFRVITTGGLAIEVAGHPSNPNLDPRLVLRGEDGQIVATSDDPSSLSGSISLPDLPAGTYTISVDGAGWGTPLASTPTGWTQYASLGQYTLTIEAADGPVDTDPPAAPVGLAAIDVTADAVTIGWDANVEPDLSSYTVERNAGGGWIVIGTTSVALYVDEAVQGSSTYQYRVSAVDTSGNTSPSSPSITVNTPIPPVEPIGPDSVVAETAVSGTVNGTFLLTESAGAGSQVLTEESSGGRPDLRFDQLDHRWQIDVTDGNHMLLIDGVVTSGGDSDAGFDISWSSASTGPWTVLGTLTASQGSLSADLGSPTGSIFVRITDTDRSAGSTGYDQVAIDLIELTGAEPPTSPPAAVTQVSPIDGATGISTNPSLSWSPVSGATEYRVSVAGDVAIPTQTTGSNSVQLTGLSPNVTYQWQIEAVNAVGASSSQIFRFTTADVANEVVVESLTTSTTSAAKGTKRVVANTSVIDDNGDPVVGAVVVVRVSGTINELVTSTSGSGGIAVGQTDQAVRKPTVSACIESVSAEGLTWVPSEFAC